MAQENDNEEDAQETAEDIVEDSGELLESVRKMIRDEIEAALSSVPGEGSVTDIKDEIDEPLTLRAMEASVRRAVEEAKPKPKKKTAPKEVEPEPAPIEKDVRSKLTSFLWGEG